MALLFIVPAMALAEDKPPQVFPKLPKTAEDPKLSNGHVYPMWGPLCQRYTYSVVYQDDKGRAPEYVKMYFNGEWLNLEKGNKDDNDYKKGVKYSYKFVPTKYGSNFYFFEASNGAGKTRASIIDSPDNGPVLFESDFKNNEIALIDPASAKKVWSYPTGEEWIGGVALSNDGKYLAAQTTRHIYLFDTSKAEPLWSYEYKGKFTVMNNDVKGGVAISGDGAKIFALIGQAAMVFDKSSNKPLWEYELTNQGYDAAISEDGSYAAVATAGSEEDEDSNLLVLWKTGSKTPLWQYHASGNFHDVSLTPDGSYIAAATGCPDRRAYIFSRDSKEPVMRSEMLAEDSPINQAKISRDGSIAAFSAEYNKGLVFVFKNPKLGGSNEPLWSFPATSNARSGRALAMTPDGKSILETTFAGEIIFFDAASNTPKFSLKVDRPLAAAGISADGALAAVGGTEKKVYLLEVAAQKIKGEISLPEYVSEIAVSASGKYVASGTGGSKYFFEKFIDDETTVRQCDKIIEPAAEANADLEGDVDGQNSKKTKQGLPIIPIALGALGAGAVVLFFFLKKKWLIALAVLFLATGAFFIFGPDLNFGSDKKTTDQSVATSPSASSTAGQSQTTDQQTSTSSSATCGNSLCEPNLGESESSCPKDCSGGDEKVD